MPRPKPSAQTNLDDSILYRMIDAGMRHNGPGFSRASVDPFRLQRFAATCPSSAEALAARLQAHPALGMPFGLPALAEEDFAILRDWIAKGSSGPTHAEEAEAQRVANPMSVAAWEAFFNGSDPRQALVSRFINGQTATPRSADQRSAGSAEPSGQTRFCRRCPDRGLRRLGGRGLQADGGPRSRLRAPAAECPGA
jgi:hypothetical protein